MRYLQKYLATLHHAKFYSLSCSEDEVQEVLKASQWEMGSLQEMIT